MANVVLDASAVLARVLSEPGGEGVGAVIRGARLSAVNFAEVVQRLAEIGAHPAEIEATLFRLEMVIEAFDARDALQVGLMRPTTRRARLSLADCACLSLARRLGLPAYTADRAWAELDLGVEVVLIR